MILTRRGEDGDETGESTTSVPAALATGEVGAVLVGLAPDQVSGRRP